MPMDLSQETLGLTQAMREELRNDLNIIINSAGTVEFGTRLDIATEINVRGPLQLMKLAEECHNFEAFTQISTMFAVSDRTGFIDEKMYESSHNWVEEYQKIMSLNHLEILEQQAQVIGRFPNNYCYTKRMAEELLVLRQQALIQAGKALPLVILRPSIIAAAHSEPFPGWTDSLGLLGGFYAIAGHGILRDLPLNPKLIGDQIPVDFVSNQLLAASALAVRRFRQSQGQDALTVTHSCTSASNGITWGDVIQALEGYWARDAYENAIAHPKLHAHTNARSYRMAFRLRSEVPASTLYYLTKIIGTKKMHQGAGEYRDYVGKCRQIAVDFAYFMNNEWIFDNASAFQMQKQLMEADPTGSQLNLVPFDIQSIKWVPFIQNHAYGIKRYILQEEAYMPSLGYHDARTRMFTPATGKLLNPWGHGIFFKKVLGFEETKQVVFSSAWVQREMDDLVARRLSLLKSDRSASVGSAPKAGGSRSKSPSKGGLPNYEEKIKQDVQEHAHKILQRIYSSFSMRALDNVVNVLVQVFKYSYKKIIVNENQIQKLKGLFASRKGPIIFCPTHRSYMDFLVVSGLLYFYGLEMPLICAGEDFLNMPFIADMLRASGAFFMRRTFRGDELYKAIFSEYVRFLNKDR